MEFDVNKGFKDDICVQYRSKENIVKGTKCVTVEYVIVSENEQRVQNNENDRFIDANYKRNNEKRQTGPNGYNHMKGGGKNGWNKNGVYRRKDNSTETMKDQQKKVHGESLNSQENMNNIEKTRSIQDELLSTIRVSPNKCAALETNTNESQELNQLKDRLIVDQFLNKKVQPSCSETSNWSKDMILYFKMKWEEDRSKEAKENSEVNKDVLEGMNIAAKVCAANVVSGMDPTVLN